MQTISEVMTRNVASISPNDSVRRAAQLMDEINVGALPICDGQKLKGIVTDRDITVRATSVGLNPDQTPVSDVMSQDLRWCFEDQNVDEVLEEMGSVQIRRVPVVDRKTHNLVGIVSLGDLATKHSSGIQSTLERISTPSEPDRPHSRQ